MRNNKGLTLLELLIVALLFAMLIGALIGLLTLGLEFWGTGEKHKELLDRSSIIMDQIAEDLKNLYTENIPGYVLTPAPFICDLDHNHLPRLRFVRHGTPERLGIDIKRPEDIPAIPPHIYADLFEIAYIQSEGTLWRGVRYFTRRTKGDTFFDDTRIQDTDSSFFRENFEPIGDGVLYIEYRFWTPYTDTWEIPPPEGKTGPQLIWDSTRTRLKDFIFYRKYFDIKRPDFTYPEAVQIMLTMQLRTPRYTVQTHLQRELKREDLVVYLEDVSEIPPPPQFIKVNREWIKYRGRSGDTLVISQRGARNTGPQRHPEGSPVRFGELITQIIPILPYRHPSLK
jgi:hypothetical protein